MACNREADRTGASAAAWGGNTRERQRRAGSGRRAAMEWLRTSTGERRLQGEGERRKRRQAAVSQPQQGQPGGADREGYEGRAARRKGRIVRKWRE